jgi:hypothetical protein
MEKLITDIQALILEKWGSAKPILASEIPDYEETNLSKLIINYNPPWFVALLRSAEDLVILMYAKVDNAGELPHLLLNYDHTSVQEYFVRYPSKYLLIAKSHEPGFYKTEFYDHNGTLFNVRNCSTLEFIYHIESEIMFE